MTYPEKITAIYQILTALATVVGAVAACLVYGKYNKRVLDAQLADYIRNMYVEFYREDRISKARFYIDNDLYYPKLASLLGTLNAKNPKITKGTKIEISLDHEDYALVDDIERFLALMLRAAVFFDRHKKMFGDVSMDSLRRVFFSYWKRRIEDRPELKEYIRIFWKELYGLTWPNRSHFS